MLALAAAYFGLARFGLSFDALGGLASAVWPPTGLAVAALVLGGMRLWPAIAVGAFAANLSSGASPLGASLIATGNTLEAVIAASLLGRVRFSPALARVRDVLALIGIGAIVSTAVSASFGLFALWLAGAARSPGHTWLVWWVGDALGALLVAPVLFTWSAGRERLARRRWVEALLVMAAAALAIPLVSFGAMPSSVTWLQHTYLVFPVLLWAALRMGPVGASSASLCVAALAIAGTATGHGPFVRETRLESLFYLQTFQAVMVMTSLLVAAAAAERDRAVRVREEFLAVASHELRTPLAPLLLGVETLARRLHNPSRELPTREELGRSVHGLSRQIARFSRLVDDLLDVSRIRSGHLELRRAPVDLAEVVRDSAARLKSDFEAAGCTLDIDAPAAVEGSWDRMRLEQVATNLLSNAAKYGGGSPVRVRVRRDGDLAVLSVRDSGMGVARGEEERIFDPFERGEAAESRAGLGLGLYITRRIVEAHGGRIRVESAPGAGAEFVVTLPP